MKANRVTTKPNPPAILLPIALLKILRMCFLFEADFYLMSQRCASWREHESFEHLISGEGGTLSLCPQTHNSHLGVPASPHTFGE